MENSINIIFKVEIPHELDKEKQNDPDYAPKSRSKLVTEATKALHEFTKAKQKEYFESDFNALMMDNGIRVSYEMEEDILAKFDEHEANKKLAEHLEALFGHDNETADKVAGLLYMQKDLFYKKLKELYK